jgi:hypothetical protein
MINNKIRIITFAVILSILLISLSYTACLQIASNTPPKGNRDTDRIPWNLNCAYVETADTYHGASWNNITIGKTYWPGLIWRLGSIGFWDRFDGNVLFQSNTSSVEACFHYGKVVALRAGSGSISNTIPDWINIYGLPEIVTWSDTYGRRSVVWPEQGVMVVSEFLAPGGADIENTGTFGLYLFPPIAAGEFENSWLGRALPDSPPDLPDESEMEEPVDCWPITEEMLLEDPWGIER